MAAWRRRRCGHRHRAIGIDLKTTSVRELHRAEADAQDSARLRLLGVGV